MLLKQSKAATQIQSAIRNRNARHDARHELDKSVEARVQRMTGELLRSQENINELRQ